MLTEFLLTNKEPFNKNITDTSFLTMSNDLGSTPPTPQLQGMIGQMILSDRLDEAEKICQDFTTKHGANAYILHFQGLIDFMRRKYDLSIAKFLRSIEVVPFNSNFFSNLGEAYRRRGEFKEAITAFQDSLLIEPENLKSHLGIANTLSDLKRYDHAKTRFQFLLKLHPNYSQGYHYLGVMLSKIDKDKEGIPMLRKAIALNPDYYEAKFSLANSLEKIGETEEAMKYYEQLLVEKPQDASAHNNYANLLRSLGRLEEAEEHFQEALKHDPTHISAYYNRSATEMTKSLNPEMVARLEASLTDSNLREEDISNLHFVLAKYYHAQKDFASAFKHYTDGNEYDCKKNPYDSANSHQAFTVLENYFNRDFFSSRRHYGCESEIPVFIFGMPRSGTTLVEQIIASHPEAFGGGELKFVSQIVQKIAEKTGYPKGAGALDVIESCTLGEQLVDQMKSLVPPEFKGVKRITDKMPGNFMSLGLMSLILPKAKLIHCRRNAVDSCFSCFTQHFTSAIPYTNRLEYLGDYYNLYERLMAHWHETLPLQILDVQYEEMVQNPEEMSRKVIDFIGLDWHENCLNFHETSRQVKTASVEQVRKPIYTSSIEKWRPYEPFLEPLFKALGKYAPLSTSLTH